MPRRYGSKSKDNGFTLKPVFSLEEFFDTPQSKLTVKSSVSPGYRISLINWGEDDNGNPRMELRVTTYVAGRFVDVLRIRLAEPSMTTRLKVVAEALQLLKKIQEKYSDRIPTIGEAKKPQTVQDLL